MYAYQWDPETGGILLKTEHLEFSKEPRPVYSKEMNLLGFNRYWKYEDQNEFPYMWAESNQYYYRGRLLIKTKGGCTCVAPSLEVQDGVETGITLQPVDIDRMIQKNYEIMNQLAYETKQKIFNVWNEYKTKKKADVFHVSYSGGKDSEVTFDLVQSALPHDAFVVIFGDTKMEFPDTYRAVENTKQRCEEEGIKFYIAKSHLEPDDSWQIFGPPSTVIRWCCSVHKTAPQLLKLREICGRADFKEMAFVGVRGYESARRSEYDFISKGTKHKGQYSCNPILEWGSAEVYLYLFMNHLQINDAYRKGNSRAGCLVCPMSAGQSDYMRSVNYPEQVQRFLDIVKTTSLVKLETPEDDARYFNTGGWKVRKNGRDLNGLREKCVEKISDKSTLITISSPRTDWKEWSKTIGELHEIGNNKYIIKGVNANVGFTVKIEKLNLKIEIPKPVDFPETVLQKQLKQVFRKASHCILCRECEADCPNGFLSMKDGMLKIDNRCLKCGNCHKPALGCLVYNSVILPKANEMKPTKSLDCYADHAPKMEWFQSLFAKRDAFFDDNNLGINMIPMFKKFLTHAECLGKEGLTKTANKCFELGLGSSAMWALMLVNLANNSPEVAWYIKNVEPEIEYSREMLMSKLEENEVKERGQRSITGAFVRILALPFGSMLGLGEAKKTAKTYLYTRHSWTTPNALVILYSLYKFAEACGGYYQFTLTRLLDHKVESDGVSPTQIFGLSREVMKPILMGLSTDYPEFINVSFTHDLDNITLREGKTALDVLDLIEA